jgi:hypothetical protein
VGSYFDAVVRRNEVNTPEPQPQLPVADSTQDTPDTGINGAKRLITLQPPTITPELDRYTQSIASHLRTPAQNTANILATAIKNAWKIDIDPDKARIATFNYEIERPKPANGKLLNSITLTDAALENMREKNPVDTTVKGPKPWWLKPLEVLEKASPLAMAVDRARHIYNDAGTHEYIFPAFNANPQHAYTANEKLHHTPQSFRDLVWQTELAQPYKTYLDTFWLTNECHYTQSSKFAFAAAAQLQHKEGSLSNYETTLAMRAAGFGADSRLSDMTAEELKAAFRKDPGIETGLLSINGSPSTDLIYVTDKHPRLNAKGKKVNHTLLYIPGNSSPIHRFDSVAQMKTWLADQGGDANKRAQLSTHFTQNDQDDKVFCDGVNQALKGLGGWSEAHRPNALGFESTNEWDPQAYITTEAVSGDPFHTLTQRQKTRAYADAAHEIVTDGDVIKSRAVTLAEASTTAALMLTPLALIIPEVAVAVEAAYVAAGVAQIGAGIDDAVHGKSTATDRTVFGLLNAAPALVHLPSRLPGLSLAGQGKVPGALEAVEPLSQPPIEFEEVSGSDEPPQATQLVELGADEVPGNSRKRIRLDETENNEGIKLSKPTEDARDLNKINDLVFTFVDTYNGADRLNIVAHGELRGSGPEAVANMVLNDVSYDADELTDMLWNNNVPTEKYANIRLLMCHSGAGGERSFAAQFQQNVGVPVKAYASKVNAEFTLDDIAAVFKSSDRTKKLVQLDEVLPADRRHRVIKKNPFSPDKKSQDYIQYRSFTYDPVHFPSRLENPKQGVVGESMPAL